MKKAFVLASAAAFAFVPAFADTECTGTVVDENGEPMVGVFVAAEGKSTGVTTDIDGNFVLMVPDGAKRLNLSFIGYKPMLVNAGKNVGTLTMDPSEQMLNDLIVTQSIARTRQTPVALSSVDAATIEVKLGSQEFPEVLKTTPGVWATKDGGGYGDAKINMRGFKSANVAVLINGVPVNDMEWGGLYWSNWAGLSDVTAEMQTQRGLGASIVSAPSVGGTIAIRTAGLDAKKGGKVWYGMGNDGLNQYGFTVSTGLMSNGWAVTVLGSRRWGDGYIQGTNFNAFNYFVNVSKRINDAHQLSLTAFGAPQTHYQRSSYDGLSIEGWQMVKQYMDSESMYRYNPTYGFGRHGERKTSSFNHYHKPQISLNHSWMIDSKSSLSTSVYVSLSSGGGYSGQGRSVTWDGQSVTKDSWYGCSNGKLNTIFRCPDGTFDYAAIQEMNAASTTGSNMVMSDSNNSHEWYGLVSTYKNALIPSKLNVTGGIDLRYYVGHHDNKIIDLYDGEYYMDDYYRKNVIPANNAAAADPNWKYEKLGIGDIVYRDYDGHTAQEGIYLQGEYFGLDKKLTAILSGTFNNTTYWRVDRFYYDKAHQRSKTLNFMAGSVKGGVNYNFDRHNNAYVNLGYITRAPFFSGGAFLSSNASNATNPDAVNEKVMSFELGYAFRSPIFSATVDAYYTKWMDKTTTRMGEITNGEHAGDRYFLNMSGVDARHMGVEVNATYLPTRWLTIEGMLSLGDWIWDSNATGYFYNQAGQPVADLSGTQATGIFAPDHAKATLNQKGVKVGGSAQWTGAISVSVKPFKGMRIGADWVASSHNYSDYQISASNFTANSTINVAEPWRIPWGNQIDLNASYTFNIGTLKATLYGNINNLCNYNYVMDAYTDTSARGTWQNAYRIFYSFGRTYSMRLKISF